MNRRKFLDKSYLGLSTILVAPETITSLGKIDSSSVTKNSKLMPLVHGMGRSKYDSCKALEGGFSAIEAAVNGVAMKNQISKYNCWNGWCTRS